MAKATAKYIRMSSRKVRRVINEIRGKHVTQAKTILKFMPYAASHVVAKVLNSAISNAKENENLSFENLKIANAFVNDAPVFKRWRPMSRGRGYPILKRNSHITIEVVPLLEDEIKPVRRQVKKQQIELQETEKATTIQEQEKVKEPKSDKVEKKKKLPKQEKEQEKKKHSTKSKKKKKEDEK